MVRTQIQLTENQWTTLKKRAAQQEISIAELIRRSVDMWLAGEQTVTADVQHARARATIGKFKSGKKDISSNHDAYLTEAFKA